jgi:hypothetical protein
MAWPVYRPAMTRLAVAIALGTLSVALLACGGGSANSTPIAGEDETGETPSPASSSPSATALGTTTRFPAPVLPTPAGAPIDTSVIPAGFLYTEEVARTPLSQEGVAWIRNEGANLPPMLAPCGQPLPPQTADAIAGRQLVLVNGTHLWKSERLVVYRDEAAAARVFANIRDTLSGCPRDGDAAGRHVDWQVEPLSIGDEAFFVGGQQYTGNRANSFHYRGVITRQGRVIHFLIDHGESTIPPTVAEEQPTTLSENMAAALRAASWAQ